MIASVDLKVWFPDWASTHAPNVDVIFYDVYFAAVLTLIVAVGTALALMQAYRRQQGDPERVPAGGTNKVALGVAVVAAVALAGYAYVAGLRGFTDQQVAPFGSYPVTVTAREGTWDFTYPGGHVSDTLRVPVGRPVLLTMTSHDIAQTLAIPAMRVQAAVLPGRETEAWFEPIAPGIFPVHAGAFSVNTVDSLATVMFSLQDEDFRSWLTAVSDIFAGRTLPEVGQLLLDREGCRACHSVDGSQVVGPTFLNVYGHEFRTTTGEVVLADDAYIKESILDPNASVIEGFQPVMTPYAGKLDDREIEAIIEYLKTISDRGGAGSQEDG